MDLRTTIEELEAQAAKYTEAAQSLRALMNENADAQKSAPAPKASTPRKKATAPVAKGKSSSGSNPQKKPMSAEARARIGAATRARFAAKKAGAAASA